MPQKASLAEIIASLEQHCQAKQTGTLRILAERGVSAAFLLNSGRIVAVQCGGKEDAEALEKIVAIQAGVAKFIEGSVENVSAASLPTNDAIFHRLLGSSSVSAPAVQGSGKPLTAAHKSLLEALMADQIGPMAQIVCANVFPSVNDTETAKATLAQQIPDPALRKQFLAAAQSKL
jgi:hypothetical protein